jgi:hypothetical protein
MSSAITPQMSSPGVARGYNGSVNPPRIVTVYFDRRQRGKT